MEKKHLLRGLTGNYGYIKPYVQSSAAVAFAEDSTDSSQPEGIQSDGRRGSISPDFPDCASHFLSLA